MMRSRVTFQTPDGCSRKSFQNDLTFQGNWSLEHVISDSLWSRTKNPVWRLCTLASSEVGEGYSGTITQETEVDRLINRSKLAWLFVDVTVLRCSWQIGWKGNSIYFAILRSFHPCKCFSIYIALYCCGWWWWCCWQRQWQPQCAAQMITSLEERMLDSGQTVTVLPWSMKSVVKFLFTKQRV